MARDVADDTYYVTSGGKIPVKWTAPEVCVLYNQTMCLICCMQSGNIFQEIFNSK